MNENQSLKTDPEVMEMVVMCVNFKCYKMIKVKHSIIGEDPGTFFCSESCKEQYLGDK